VILVHGGIGQTSVVAHQMRTLIGKPVSAIKRSLVRVAAIIRVVVRQYAPAKTNMYMIRFAQCMELMNYKKRVKTVSRGD